MTVPRPVTVLICALGGEGGGVLAEWLYAAAVRAGRAAQSTSIPGVAQRTGATTYYIEIFPTPLAELGGRRPVFSLNPVPGGIDLLVSSELLETVRQLGNGMGNAERTTVISSTVRALTVAEKMAQTDGRVDEATLVAALQQQGRRIELLDTAALAREAGTAVSAVLFGAAAGSGVLPLGDTPAAVRAVCEAAIRASGKGVEASLRGFGLAFDRIAARERQQAVVQAALDGLAAAPPGAPDPRRGEASATATAASVPLPDTWRARFPVSMHERLGHAHARLVEYQDAAYAATYAERLGRLLDAERRGAAPAADDAAPVTTEASRWLALWMAFDDIVRVAALKLAASRQQRVRREVAARDGEIVKVFDHFKPGVPEFAALLPARLAARLVAWDRRRIAAGREPWALPLRVGTHTVAGALALRVAASLKGQRRRGSRFALEQALIDEWLGAVERGTREDPALGLELARCGRLVKGYGSTNERGKENLLHIVRHLAVSPAAAPKPSAERAAAVRAAREAALADDAGRALDATLVAHGAPKRAPREQVVRWYKRRPAGTGSAD